MPPAAEVIVLSSSSPYANVSDSPTKVDENKISLSSRPASPYESKPSKPVNRGGTDRNANATLARDGSVTGKSKPTTPLKTRPGTTIVEPNKNGKKEDSTRSKEDGNPGRDQEDTAAKKGTTKRGRGRASTKAGESKAADGSKRRRAKPRAGKTLNVVGNIQNQGHECGKDDNGKMTPPPPDELENSDSTQGLQLDPALKRRLDWTPPMDTKSSNDTVDLVSSGGKGSSEKGASRRGFSGMLSGYNFDGTLATCDVDRPSEDGGGLIKRRRLEVLCEDSLSFILMLMCSICVVAR